MNKTVVLLGAPSSEETVLCTDVLRRTGYRVLCSSDAETFRSEYPQVLPAAFISWAECSQMSLLTIFSLLPIGTGERIPFFQYVDGAVPEWLRKFPVAGLFSLPLAAPVLESMVCTITRNRVQIDRQMELTGERDHAHAEMEKLVAVGTALSSEHDLKRLMELILTNCRNAVCADAGSVYVRDRSLPGGPLTDSLLFMVAQNDSVDTGNSGQYRLPINAESIAGYVALTGKPLRIDDVAKIPADAPFKTSRTFQRYFEYCSKSMLTVPLVNLQQEVVGVLQLLNRKKEAALPLLSEIAFETGVDVFSPHDERFVLSVAQLAAVSIERAQLHENVTALFEGFLNASITSVDERDRVTSGHSRRVMRYAMAFVDAAEKYPDHPFHVLSASLERRRQFQFAALLHDIGKIGVPEYILTKEQRLPKDELNMLMGNLDYIGFTFSVAPETVEWTSREEIDADRTLLLRVNSSGRIDTADLRRITELGKKTFVDYRGDRVPLLSAYATEALTVAKGNLTAVERELICSHAQSTHRILTMIPWTDALKDVPYIAAQHHERIDGTGYPQGITGDRMFLESKILAAIDIYEALVAQDRPYKPRMPVARALDILMGEAAAGHLDSEVVRFFIANKIHLLYNQHEEEGV